MYASLQILIPTNLHPHEPPSPWLKIAATWKICVCVVWSPTPCSDCFSEDEDVVPEDAVPKDVKDILTIK